jgi:hypothetical protein
MQLMKYIAVIAVAGILALQAGGAIPQSSVGGPITIALAFFMAALAVGIHEAFTNNRGIVGWIVNLIVSLIGAFVAASVGGPVAGILFSSFNPGQSLAATGGPLMAAALASVMLMSVYGAYGAIKLVNRLRA